MVDFHIRNPKAYGLRERKEEKQHFPYPQELQDLRRYLCTYSIVTGLVALILLPFGKNLFNLSIDFAGGTEMEFNMHTAVTQDIQTEVSRSVQGRDRRGRFLRHLLRRRQRGRADPLDLDRPPSSALPSSTRCCRSTASPTPTSSTTTTYPRRSAPTCSARPFICAVLAIAAHAAVHHLPLRADQRSWLRSAAWCTTCSSC